MSSCFDLMHSVGLRRLFSLTGWDICKLIVMVMVSGSVPCQGRPCVLCYRVPGQDAIWYHAW